MSTPYLITFTPAGHFFFGGPVSFSDYVESEKFPQPTTVIGALRAALLTGNALLVQHKRGRFVPKDKKEEAKKLVGTSKVNCFEDSSDFGIIEKLSHPFLIKKARNGDFEDAFFPVPKDVVKNENLDFKITSYDKIDNAFSCNCGRKANFVLKSYFKPKEEVRGDFLGGKNFWDAYLMGRCNSEGVIDLGMDDKKNPFIRHSQVGIGLTKKKTEEGKLYVKYDYTLRAGYEFSVICWLSEEEPSMAETVVLGGEQSVFFLKKKKININKDKDVLMNHPVICALLNGNKTVSSICEKEPDSFEKLIAISPLVVDSDSILFKNSEHAIVNRISNVRMLNSIIVPEAKTYSGNSPDLRDGKKILKSDAYRVIPAGSVFYYGNAAWQGHAPRMADKIGYNFTMTFKGGAEHV